MGAQASRCYYAETKKYYCEFNSSELPVLQAICKEKPNYYK